MQSLPTITHQHDIVSYLYRNVVTLSLIELLLPKFQPMIAIKNKIATNIGWWHMQGVIIGWNVSSSAAAHNPNE